MRLMAVMAHPDDAEIWCGGTLILHAQRGDAVRICTLGYTGDSIRGREAQEAARIMGCEVESLGMDDTAIRDTEPAVERIIISLKSFKPDMIITHWYDDMHPDHEATFSLIRRALLRTFLETPLAKNELPNVFCCDTYLSLGLHGPFIPDRFLDVTGAWKKKINAIEAHKSQDLEFYLEMIERQCLEHGKLIQTKFAEGFICLPWFERPDDGLFTRRKHEMPKVSV